jgi:hypothetical protein
VPEPRLEQATFLLPKARFSAVAGGNLRGNSFRYCLKKWQNALTYQTVTHITSPHINPELLLVSIMGYMYHVDALLPTDDGCGYFDAICTEQWISG